MRIVPQAVTTNIYNLAIATIPPSSPTQAVHAGFAYLELLDTRKPRHRRQGARCEKGREHEDIKSAIGVCAQLCPRFPPLVLSFDLESYGGVPCRHQILVLNMWRGMHIMTNLVKHRLAKTGRMETPACALDWTLRR